MSRRGVKPRPAWEDRFVLPQRLDLLAAFGKHQRALIDLLRSSLMGLPEVEETMTWQGIPWRWTFGYAMEGETDRPWAYLIPHPARPMFVLPVRDEELVSLDLRRVSRPVRDAIAPSTHVAGRFWPQWELTTRMLTEDLAALARRRYEILHAVA